MSILVSGSIAYDTVCRFEGRFADYIVPEASRTLNLTFAASSSTHAFGGCATNIAWSLALMGGKPLIFGAVGQDGGRFLKHLESLGLSTELIARHADEWTARVFITTDRNGCQLSTFDAGAMRRAGELQVPETGIELAHIAPGWAPAMLTQGRICRQRSIPVVFDPGQATSQLSEAALEELCSLARLICLSEYEARLLEKRLGRPAEAWVSNSRAVLITRGAAGATMLGSDGVWEIAPVPAARAVDPVGAGDAFRGGLLAGWQQKLPLETCARLGAVIASFKVEQEGAHNYRPAPEDIKRRYEGFWKEAYPLA